MCAISTNCEIVIFLEPSCIQVDGKGPFLATDPQAKLILVGVRMSAAWFAVSVLEELVGSSWVDVW